LKDVNKNQSRKETATKTKQYNLVKELQHLILSVKNNREKQEHTKWKHMNHCNGNFQNFQVRMIICLERDIE
jgi:hypothetical protein